MRKTIILVAGILLACGMAAAQTAMKQNPDDTQHTRLDYIAQRFDLWENGNIPGSKGLALTDSVYNDRTWRIMMPRVYVYRPEKGKRNDTAVLVIPGGGYAKQAYEIAGIETAEWLNSLGITAFILIHRLPNSPDLEDGEIAPVQDAQRAMRFIRAHAQEYGLNPSRIGVMGASSGGHVSACLSTMNDDLSACGDDLDRQPFKPDFGILISPVITMEEPYVHKGSRQSLLGRKANDPSVRARFSMERQVTASNPPMLFIHAGDDTGVPQENSLMMFKALMAAGVRKSSFHVFPQGQHSIKVSDQPGSTALWPEIARLWMNEIGMLE